MTFANLLANQHTWNFELFSYFGLFSTGALCLAMYRTLAAIELVS